MFKHLRVNEQTKCIDGLPKEWVTLFLAKVSARYGLLTHCAVICPDVLLPEKNQFYSSIVGAKVVLFNGRAFNLIDIIEGYKVRKGGCRVQYIKKGLVAFPGEIHSYDGEQTFEDRLLRPQDVLVAL